MNTVEIKTKSTEEIKAGNFLLKPQDDGRYAVLKWTFNRMARSSFYLLVGYIKIDSCKIKKFKAKPSSGACDASIKVMLKSQCGVVI